MRLDATREMQDQLERGLIAPVHVLEREVHRLRACQLRERVAHGVKEAPALVLRFDGLERRELDEERRELREHTHQLGGSWRECVRGERVRRVGRESADEVEQRRIGVGAIRLEAGAMKDDAPTASRFSRCLAKHSRLSDACLAANEQDATAPARRPLEQRTYHVQRPVASHQDGADDTAIPERRWSGVPAGHPGRVGFPRA